MLKKLRKWTAGVSLFEMLLVMVIISVIVVAAIQYARHQQEISADQVYGQKLYTFGQAVNSYVNHSPSLRANFTLPGPVATDGTATVNPDPSIVLSTDPTTGAQIITVTGVDWLKQAEAGTYNGVPFIDDNFTFGAGLAPLIVGRDTGDGNIVQGDAAFTTQISFVEPTNPTNSAFNITVNAGVLYEQPSSKKAPLIPMAALSQDAVKHANELYTSYQGAAAINYTIPLTDASGNYVAPTAATGQISPIAQSGDAFLRTDGTNNMEASIHFDPLTLAPLGNGTIEDINQINFFDDPNGTAVIQSIQEMDFLVPLDGSPAPGVINSLNAMNMINNTDGPSMISNLSTLSFTTENTAALIENLKMLNFVSGGVTHPAIPGTVAIPPTSKKVCHTCGAQSGHAGTGNCCHQETTLGVPAVPTIPAYTEPGSQITGLNEILFSVPPVSGSTQSSTLSFMGITALPPQTLRLITTSSLSNQNLNLVSSVGTFCALTQVQVHDNIEGSGSDKSCTIALSSDKSTWVLTAFSSNGNESVVCSATCFQFTTNASPSSSSVTPAVSS